MLLKRCCYDNLYWCFLYFGLFNFLRETPFKQILSQFIKNSIKFVKKVKIRNNNRFILLKTADTPIRKWVVLLCTQTSQYTRKVHSVAGENEIFSRIINSILNSKPSNALNLLKKILNVSIIELVTGYGKEKYKFNFILKIESCILFHQTVCFE